MTTTNGRAQLDHETRDYLRSEIDRRRRIGIGLARGTFTRAELREEAFAAAIADLGPGLKGARSAHGVGTRTLGRQTAPFVTQSAIWRIEEGERVPTLRSLWALSEALGVRIVIEPTAVRVEELTSRRELKQRHA